MRTKIATALSGTGFPVFWQRVDTAAELPSAYFVFTTMSAPKGYADNTHTARVTYVYLNFYSMGPFEETLAGTIRSGMTGQGFVEVSTDDVSDIMRTSNSANFYHLAMTWFFREAL